MNRVFGPVLAERIHLLWLGLLGLVVIFVVAMGAEALRIERSITQQAGVALAGAGYTRVHVDVRGRDLGLSGFVSSAEGKQRVEQIASAIAGVRRVDSAVSVVVHRLPWLRLVTDDQGALTLSGSLPRQQDVDRVISALQENGVEVRNLARIDTEVGAPQWWPVLQPALALAESLERYRMEIGGNEVTVAGRAGSTSSLRSALQSLRLASDSMTFRLINRIAILSG